MARPALSAAARAAAASPTVKACGGLPAFSKAAADEIMDGNLTLSPFARVTIDPNRDGNINWNQNPYHHPTWQQGFQSGGWIEMLISGYLAGGPQAGAYRARAEALAKGWLKNVPIANRDPRELICLSEGFPGQKWIDDQIAAERQLPRPPTGRAPGTTDWSRTSSSCRSAAPTPPPPSAPTPSGGARSPTSRSCRPSTTLPGSAPPLTPTASSTSRP